MGTRLAMVGHMLIAALQTLPLLLVVALFCGTLQGRRVG